MRHSWKYNMDSQFDMFTYMYAAVGVYIFHPDRERYVYVELEYETCIPMLSPQYCESQNARALGVKQEATRKGHASRPR